MNSPNLAPNAGARLGNSPLNTLNTMNNMNAPSMGSPINQNPHVMKNNGQMCPPLSNLNSLNSPLGNGGYFWEFHNKIFIIFINLLFIL